MRADLEPPSGVARPRDMRPLGSAVRIIGLALALTGCGSAEDPASEQVSGQPGQPSEASSAPAWHGCDAAAFDAASAQAAGRVTGPAGEQLLVKLVTGSGPCAGGLVAETPSGITGLAVSELDLDASTAELVRVGGDAGDLLRIDGGAHPRGGFQPHLFRVTENGVAEVTVEGSPLLPFVATDGGAKPATVRCAAPGTVELLDVTTSKPPGVVLAWDVYRTTYRVDTAQLERTEPKLIRDHAADPVLRREMAQLFEPGALFANCSEPWSD
jgi:hypothetical protein